MSSTGYVKKGPIFFASMNAFTDLAEILHTFNIIYYSFLSKISSWFIQWFRSYTYFRKASRKTRASCFTAWRSIISSKKERYCALLCNQYRSTWLKTSVTFSVRHDFLKKKDLGVIETLRQSKGWGATRIVGSPCENKCSSETIEWINLKFYTGMNNKLY